MSAEDFEGAERGLRRALRLQEGQLGLVHPDVARTLNALGVVCHALGRPDEAEFLYRRAVGIARKEFTDEQPYIATGLRNLSELYQSQAKPEKLSTLSERLVSRSGLPRMSSDEVTVEADATAGGETGRSPATPSPASRVFDRLSNMRARSWRWRPVVLWPGTLVVLSLVVWVAILVGNRPPYVAANTPEGAAVSSEPLMERPNTTRNAGVDSRGAPSDVADGNGGHSVESTLPTVAALVETAGVPQSSPLARLAPPDEARDASGWTVAEANLCSDLATRGADGTPLSIWGCTPIADPTVPGAVFFYTRVR